MRRHLRLPSARPSTVVRETKCSSSHRRGPCARRSGRHCARRPHIRIRRRQGYWCFYCIASPLLGRFVQSKIVTARVTASIRGEHAFEDSQNTADLLAVPVDGTGHLLLVIEQEPAGLAEVWTLARGLEEQPLGQRGFLVRVCDRNLMV